QDYGRKEGSSVRDYGRIAQTRQPLSRCLYGENKLWLRCLTDNALEHSEDMPLGSVLVRHGSQNHGRNVPVFPVHLIILALGHCVDDNLCDKGSDHLPQLETKVRVSEFRMHLILYLNRLCWQFLEVVNNGLLKLDRPAQVRLVPFKSL